VEVVAHDLHIVDTDDDGYCLDNHQVQVHVQEVPLCNEVVEVGNGVDDDDDEVVVVVVLLHVDNDYYYYY